MHAWFMLDTTHHSGSISRISFAQQGPRGEERGPREPPGRAREAQDRA